MEKPDNILTFSLDGVPLLPKKIIPLYLGHYMGIIQDQLLSLGVASQVDFYRVSPGPTKITAWFKCHINGRKYRITIEPLEEQEENGQGDLADDGVTLSPSTKP